MYTVSLTRLLTHLFTHLLTYSGPFTSEQISEWKSQGYFTGPTAVMMRKVGVAGSDWSQIDERAAKKRKATGTHSLTYLLTHLLTQ